MAILVAGAFGCIGSWGESAAIADIVSLLEEAWPAAKGQITYAGEPIPLPAALTDHGWQRDLGPKPSTSLVARLRLAAYGQVLRRPGTHAGGMGARSNTASTRDGAIR